MRAFSIAIIVTALIVGVISTEEQKSNVEVLTDATFDEKTQNGVWMVLFHIPSCSRCKRVIQRWSSLTTTSLGKLHVGTIDCSTNPKHCVDIYDYPTIRLFSEGEEGFVEYQGYEITTNTLLDFAQDNTKTNLELVKVADNVQERLEDLVEQYTILSKRTDELNSKLADLVRKMELREEEEFINEVNRISKVVHLTPENYKAETSKGKWLVMLELPYWPAAKDLTMAWEAYATIYARYFKVAKIDCSRYKKFCSENGWHNFLSIMTFNEGKMVEYEGKNTPDDIKQFALKMLA